jgi:hypothetical protein
MGNRASHESVSHENVRNQVIESNGSMSWYEKLSDKEGPGVVLLAMDDGGCWLLEELPIWPSNQCSNGP